MKMFNINFRKGLLISLPIYIVTFISLILLNNQNIDHFITFSLVAMSTILFIPYLSVVFCISTMRKKIKENSSLMLKDYIKALMPNVLLIVFNLYIISLALSNVDMPFIGFFIFSIQFILIIFAFVFWPCHLKGNDKHERFVLFIKNISSLLTTITVTAFLIFAILKLFNLAYIGPNGWTDPRFNYAYFRVSVFSPLGIFTVLLFLFLFTTMSLTESSVLDS